MRNPFSLTTRQAAVRAGIEQHVLLSNFRRHGHWKGVIPRKLPNGRLLWPAVKVYEAVGLIPSRRHPLPEDAFRERICSLTDADLNSSHLIASYLHSEQACGITARDKLSHMFADVQAFVPLLYALARRIGSAMNCEDELTSDEWKIANSLADDLERECERVCGPLRWSSGDTGGK